MSKDIFSVEVNDEDSEHYLSGVISTDNDEILGDDGFLNDPIVLDDIVVYSRDWTVETVVSQIINGNIDLNPEFQRRNAWNDTKKSSLIESYLMGYPVPEIVLAEHPREKKKFIVIDGKQRLLTLCGFLLHKKYDVWKRPVLSGLKDIRELNGKGFSDMKKEPNLNKYLRHLANSDVRCTIISNVKNDDILYDIFYRLNAGATPLSVQELRQVLYSGPFTKFLVEYTSEIGGIHHVLNLKKPDDRLKDVEILLRILSFLKKIDNYDGNLKKFLDNFTVYCNENWADIQPDLLKVVEHLESSIKLLSDKFGASNLIGRKWNDEKKRMDSRFNTVLFEVQVYFAFYYPDQLARLNPEVFCTAFSTLCEDKEFMASISSSTKNIKEYSIRYSMYGNMLSSLSGEEIKSPWMM